MDCLYLTNVIRAPVCENKAAITCVIADRDKLFGARRLGQFVEVPGHMSYKILVSGFSPYTTKTSEGILTLPLSLY